MSTGLIILTASPLNAFGDFSIPDGWLLCDGRTYDKNEYLNLYRHLLKNGPNSTFDSINNPLLYGGDANTFKVPDLTDKFMRGYKDGQDNLQLGMETNEQVNLDGVSVTANSSISFGNNDRPYHIDGLATDAGIHSHIYFDQNRAKISDSELGQNTFEEDHGVFHRLEAGNAFDSDTTPGTHLRMSGQLYDTACDYASVYSYDYYAPGDRHGHGHWGTWSVSYSNQYNPPEGSQQRLNQMVTMVAVGNNGNLWGDDRNNPWDTWIGDTFTGIRHIHKYIIDVNDDAGHQHTLPNPINETHKHTHTVGSFSNTTQSSLDGQELRPANTRMTYLIYTK